MTLNRPYIVDESFVSLRSEKEAPGRTLRGDLNLVRLIFYVHLLAVTLCVILACHDARQLQIPDVVTIILPIVAPPLFASWMLFLPMMVVAASRLQDRATVFRLAIIASDLLLSIFQVWALLPLVQ
jgi:hypothetical protein